MYIVYDVCITGNILENILEKCIIYNYYVDCLRGNRYVIFNYFKNKSKQHYTVVCIYINCQHNIVKRYYNIII